MSVFLKKNSFHVVQHGGAVAQLVERRANNRKVAIPWFDCQCGSALQCPWEDT